MIAANRDWLFLNCQVAHQWETIGGANCGCEDGACSVPVRQCAVCGDCDYGENEDATNVRDNCHELRGLSIATKS